ncbi:hypothetical protein [Mucilaginibacter sp. PAMB04168]|uniref:toxin-antitoxin system YwqK family antitoxin n=1 Tax=Mucilaginibacter sp. PAMB04168 TaxID=3138567 RepID=UPI0031F64106
MTKTYLTLLALLSTLTLYAQKWPEYGLSQVRIIEADRTIVARIEPSGKPDIYTGRQYYWYSSNTIQTTQGGFSGRLLHGIYQEFYISKNLKTQGYFKKGLKDGVWKSWNENGTLIETETWQQGSKNGEFTTYDALGRQKQQGNYKDGFREGKVRSYQGPDSVTTVRYKAGQPVKAAPASPTVWQKLKEFRLWKKHSPKTTA